MKFQGINKTALYRKAGLIVIALALLASGIQAQTETGNRSWRTDRALFGDLRDPATDYFQSDEFQKILDAPDAIFDKSLSQIHTLEYDFPIGQGQWMHVTETFTLESWLRRPRRAVLMPGGAISNGDLWRIPVAEYDGTGRAARRGMFAFTIDLLGQGKSFVPENGLDSSFERNVEGLETILRFIRGYRQVPKVDIVAESWGATMATQLAADRARVRAVVLSSTVYQTFTTPFPPPGLAEFIASLPNAYQFLTEDRYLPLLVTSPPAVAEYVLATQPGRYPVTQTVDALESLPFFDPSVARVPGLIVHGSLDPVAAPQDPYDLAAHYGRNGNAQVVVIEGGGHVPRIEASDIANQYWSTVFAFIDPED